LSLTLRTNKLRLIQHLRAINLCKVLLLPYQQIIDLTEKYLMPRLFVFLSVALVKLKKDLIYWHRVGQVSLGLSVKNFRCKYYFLQYIFFQVHCNKSKTVVNIFFIKTGNSILFFLKQNLIALKLCFLQRSHTHFSKHSYTPQSVLTHVSKHSYIAPVSILTKTFKSVPTHSSQSVITNYKNIS
jgi:hypothetical protein